MAGKSLMQKTKGGDRSTRKKNVSMRGKRPGPSKENVSMRGKGPSKENMSMRGKSKEKASKFDKTAATKTAGTKAVDATSKVEKTAEKPPQQAATKKSKAATREKLKDGQELRSELFQWKVVNLLGSGGFGDVYKVFKVNNDDKKEYALKTEQVEGDRRLLRLKVELSVLQACQEITDPEKKKHFVLFADRGITEKFKFIVMELVGPSLEDIRRKFLGNKFSIATAYYCAFQTLEAVKDLHAVGWLHRDIKPHNFCVGLEDKESTVYMLDFGIARKIYSKDGRTVKVARTHVKFLGTLRYASRACHQGLDQGMKDDLETWIYMVFEMVDFENGLPWKKAADRSEVIDMKENFCNYCPAECFNIVPLETKEIVEYINRQRYHEEPDYNYIRDMLIGVCQKNNISMEEKPEWLGKLVVKEEEEKKEEEKETSADNRQSGSGEGSEEAEEEKKEKKSDKNQKKKATSMRSVRRKLK